MEDLDEVVAEFLAESGEALDRLDDDLLALERDPSALDRLSSALRTVHTIKGTCGFLGYRRLEAVTHSGEALLARLREGEAGLDPPATTALLALGDAIRSLLAGVARTGAEPEEDHAPLVAELQRLAAGARAAASSAPAEAVHVPACVASPPPRAGPAADQAPAQHGDARIRVDTALLDGLAALVGDLAAARDELERVIGTTDDPALQSSARRLDRIAVQLHQGVMQTRMQPIGTAWARIPRIVRDLSVTLGRQVRVVTLGDDIPVDRALIEALRDPLTHLVRNAVDHGIEPPHVRVAAGKAPAGTLTLRAVRVGGHLVLDVSDDGGGVAAEAVLARAVERGLLPGPAAALLDERAARRLILAPGLSTAAVVTSVSGRGVGLDVVQTRVGRIGGSVEVLSRPGHGTTFRLEVPLVPREAAHPPRPLGDAHARSECRPHAKGECVDPELELAHAPR